MFSNDNDVDESIQQPTICKKYIRMMKSEPISKFVKQRRIYKKHMRAVLYHTFLVIMLGSTVLVKSVEEEIYSNDFKVLI
jgi:hypothetical protein